VGYFYIDESIHERAGFILAAYVYSAHDLTPLVYERLRSVGLEPGKNEFKSSTKMTTDPIQRTLRSELKEVLRSTKLGLVVIPSTERYNLGAEALRGLNKILQANKLTNQRHHIYFDQGIVFRRHSDLTLELGMKNYCDILVGQDSRLIGGLQLADLAAHTMSVMLLETLGVVTKTVKAGPNSGYDPDLDIEIGFEMWASLRYHFFTMDNIDPEADDQLMAFTLDTGSYAVYISDSCTDNLRSAVEKRFGKCYLGCIH
jgi:hypothetical protein